MPKMIAGLLIIIASALLGASLSGVYKKRIKFLTDYLEFLMFAQGQIGFYKREMKSLINNFTENKDGEFSRFLREKFVEDRAVTMNMDCQLVAEFITGMEELDSDSQKGFASICMERAKKYLSEAETALKTKGALSVKLFPLGGAALFLVII